MSELVFFCGTMDCGKSTLALQLDHNHRRCDRQGLIFSAHDRAGSGLLSSRLGLRVPAREVDTDTDFWGAVVATLQTGGRVDYLICDEAQFYTAAQVEDLARIVDDLAVDVYAFGITSDFRTRLFPGSQRLLELADRVEVLQVQTLCWCGARGTHNARTVDGVMVVEGAQVVVGDTGAEPVERPQSAAVAYEVLCRRHHMRRMTAARARAVTLSPAVLPFDTADASHAADPVGAAAPGSRPGRRP